MENQQPPGNLLDFSGDRDQELQKRWEKLKVDLRCLACAGWSSTVKMTVDDLNWSYARFYKCDGVPYQDFRFSRLLDLMLAMPDVLKLEEQKCKQQQQRQQCSYYYVTGMPSRFDQEKLDNLRENFARKQHESENNNNNNNDKALFSPNFIPRECVNNNNKNVVNNDAVNNGRVVNNENVNNSSSDPPTTPSLSSSDQLMLDSMEFHGIASSKKNRENYVKDDLLDHNKNFLASAYVEEFCPPYFKRKSNNDIWSRTTTTNDISSDMTTNDRDTSNKSTNDISSNTTSDNDTSNKTTNDISNKMTNGILLTKQRRTVDDLNLSGRWPDNRIDRWKILELRYWRNSVQFKLSSPDFNVPPSTSSSSSSGSSRLLYDRQEFLSYAPDNTQESVALNLENYHRILRERQQERREFTMQQQPQPQEFVHIRPVYDRLAKKREKFAKVLQERAQDVQLEADERYAERLKKADQIFPTKPPPLDQSRFPSGVELPPGLWNRIYTVLRLFPEGLEHSMFMVEYSRIWKQSLGDNQLKLKCHVKNVVALVLSMPDVEPLKVGRGKWGYVLRRPYSDRPPMDFNEKMHKVERIKKSGNGGGGGDVDDDDGDDEDLDESGDEADFYDNQSATPTGSKVTSKAPSVVAPSVVVLPPLQINNLPKHARISDDLRLNIYKLLSKEYPDGVDVVLFNERFARRYGYCINANRDCHMETQELFEALKDILLLTKDELTGRLWIKPKPIEMFQFQKRPSDLSFDISRSRTSSFSTSCPPQQQNVDAAALAPPPVENNILSPQILSEEDVLTDLYDVIAKTADSGIRVQDIPKQFQEELLIRSEVDELNLVGFLGKFPNLFELRPSFNDPSNVYVRVRPENLKQQHRYAAAAPKTGASTSTPATGANLQQSPGSVNRQRQPSRSSTVASPSGPNLLAQKSKHVSTEDLRAIFVMMTSTVSGRKFFKFDTMSTFYELTCGKPVPSTNSMLLSDFCEKPQYFVMNFTNDSVSAREYKKIEASSKLSKIAFNSAIRLPDACYHDAYVNYLRLEKGERLEVKVSFVDSPDSFFVQLRALLTEFKDLTCLMNEFYSNALNFIVPRQFLVRGFVCSALIDNDWRRVEILEVFDDSCYLVQCLDFGFSTSVVYKNLRLLKKEFVEHSLPIVAVRLSLYAIEPENPDEGWDLIVRRLIEEWTNKPEVVINVENLNEIRLSSPEVTLSVKTGNNRFLVVNEELVRLGYARYKQQQRRPDSASFSTNRISSTDQTPTNQKRDEPQNDRSVPTWNDLSDGHESSPSRFLHSSEGRSVAAVSSARGGNVPHSAASNPQNYFAITSVHSAVSNPQNYSAITSVHSSLTTAAQSKKSQLNVLCPEFVPKIPLTVPSNVVHNAYYEEDTSGRHTVDSNASSDNNLNVPFSSPVNYANFSGVGNEFLPQIQPSYSINATTSMGGAVLQFGGGMSAQHFPVPVSAVSGGSVLPPVVANFLGPPVIFPSTAAAVAAGTEQQHPQTNPYPLFGGMESSTVFTSIPQPSGGPIIVHHVYYPVPVPQAAVVPSAQNLFSQIPPPNVVPRSITAGTVPMPVPVQQLGPFRQLMQMQQQQQLMQNNTANRGGGGNPPASVPLPPGLMKNFF